MLNHFALTKLICLMSLTVLNNWNEEQLVYWAYIDLRLTVVMYLITLTDVNNWNWEELDVGWASLNLRFICSGWTTDGIVYPIACRFLEPGISEWQSWHRRRRCQKLWPGSLHSMRDSWRSFGTDWSLFSVVNHKIYFWYRTSNSRKTLFFFLRREKVPTD